MRRISLLSQVFLMLYGAAGIFYNLASVDPVSALSVLSDDPISSFGAYAQCGVLWTRWGAPHTSFFGRRLPTFSLVPSELTRIFHHNMQRFTNLFVRLFGVQSRVACSRYQTCDHETVHSAFYFIRSSTLVENISQFNAYLEGEDTEIDVYQKHAHAFSRERRGVCTMPKALVVPFASPFRPKMAGHAHTNFQKWCVGGANLENPPSHPTHMGEQ